MLGLDDRVAIREPAAEKSDIKSSDKKVDKKDAKAKPEGKPSNAKSDAKPDGGLGDYRIVAKRCRRRAADHRTGE